MKYRVTGVLHAVSFTWKCSVWNVYASPSKGTSIRQDGEAEVPVRWVVSSPSNQ